MDSKTPSSILNTLINNHRVVECPTDDFLERTRDMSAAEFSREFEKKVGGLGGFGAPLWPAIKRMIKGRGIKYCGCCGRVATAGEWCKRCADHVDRKKTFWDATYLTQHGVDCPYQPQRTGEK